jgi:drug/metabolite transporter (DMT)-like permease
MSRNVPAAAATERRAQMDAFGAGILVSFSLLLGLNQALVKLVNEGLAPVFQSGLRSACAFLPVLAYALLRRKRLSLSDGTLALGLANGLLFSGEFCLLFLALDYTSVSRASLFFYTMPLWVAVGAHFLFPEERLSAPRILGLLLAAGGVSIGLIGRDATLPANAWLGDLLSLAAAGFWAAIALLTRGTRLASATPEMNLLYQLGVSAILLTALAPLFGDTVRALTPVILGIFAFQVIIVVAIGFLVWFWVLSVYPVSDMASFSLLTPVFGVAAGWLIFDEALTAAFFLSLLLVGSGLVLVNRRG